MRLVYVSWEHPPHRGGGIGTFVHAASRTHAARGRHVRVVTIGGESTPAREVADGVTIIRLPQRHTAPRGPIETLAAWQEWSQRVAELLVKLAGDADLIEFCDLRGEAAAFLHATTPAQRPVSVVRLHTPTAIVDRFNAAPARRGVLEALELDAIRAADRVVSPSWALVELLRDELGGRAVDISRHAVAPEFLAPATADERRAAAALGIDEHTILYVGRCERRKGVETLIAAAPRLLAARAEARLALVGGDTSAGPDHPSMRAALQARLGAGLAPRVRFVDPHPAGVLRAIYDAARLCVLPSRFENFPNTCLEAMARGRLVLGSSATGMAEIIEHGRTGLLAPPDDVAALAAALVAAYDMSAAERERIGRAARAHVEAAFSPDVIAAEHEALYARYIAEHGRAAPAPRRRTPGVAVVIPCFNHGRFVAGAVASATAQTRPPADVIVVDDGSTEDATRDALDRLARSGGGVRVIRQENRGLSAARNAGVAASDAEFFVPLDADDRLAPTFIERLAPVLEGDAALGYAYCHVRYTGDGAGVWACPPYDPQRLLVENLSAATGLVRRRAFDEAGGYTPEMASGFEDWEFWIALLAVGWRGRCVPEPLFEYRQHRGGSMLARSGPHREAMLNVVVSRHTRLFAAAFADVVGRKDALFAAAQQDAAALRAALLRTHALADAASDDPERRRLLAQAELDYIVQSRFWRAAERLRACPGAALVLGRKHAHDAPSDPCAELAAIKSSPAFRLIQAIKRTWVYRRYAERRYGAAP